MEMQGQRDRIELNEEAGQSEREFTLLLLFFMSCLCVFLVKLPLLCLLSLARCQNLHATSIHYDSLRNGAESCRPAL